MEKTNVMRVLDQKKITYKGYEFPLAEAVNGVEIASLLNQDPKRVFKTLVNVDKSKKYYVFMIPVEQELDLKKGAKAVGEKAIEMVKSKELLPLTGYVHGGCSPIGMKKFFTTTVHITAKDFDTIFFSAGKIGYQVEVAPSDLEKVIRLSYYEVV